MRLQDLLESREESFEEDFILEDYLIEEEILTETPLLLEELLNEDILTEAYVYKKNFTKFLKQNLNLGAKNISVYPSLNKVYDLEKLKKAIKATDLKDSQSRMILAKATRAASKEISRKAIVRKKIENFDNELKQAFGKKETARIKAILTDIKKIVADERVAIKTDKKELNIIKRGIKNRSKAVINRVKSVEKAVKKADKKAKRDERIDNKSRISPIKKAKEYAVDFSKTAKKTNFAKKVKATINRKKIV